MRAKGYVGTTVTIAAIAALSAGSSAFAATTKYTFSHVKVKHCATTYVNQINAGGEIVGTEYCNKLYRGFVEQPSGSPTFFRAPGNKVYTLCSGISTNGTVALESVKPKGNSARYTGYLRSSTGKFTKIEDPNASPDGYGTVVNGVNASGEAVGVYYPGKGSLARSFVYTDGTFKTLHLGVKGAHEVSAGDVNDSGAIVGYYSDSKHVYHGFMRFDGKTTIINDPAAGKKAGEGTQVFYVTNDDDYTGAIYYATGGEFTRTSRGFVDLAGNFSSVTIPKSYGGYNTSVSGMSASGEIVGGYYVKTGSGKKKQNHVRGFTAVPSGLSAA